jgi:hypothetical protein
MQAGIVPRSARHVRCAMPAGRCPLYDVLVRGRYAVSAGRCPMSHARCPMSHAHSRRAWPAGAKRRK